MVDERRAAYLRAYELFEDVQSEQQAAAVAALPDALKVAATQGWREVEFVLAAAGAVHALVGGDGHIGAAVEVQGLVTRAEDLDAPALLAVALGLRAVAAASVGDTAGLMSDASRAVALLDDESQPPLDRSTGYVVTAAAFNTLRLWELVDELYTLAGDVEQDCPVPVQAAAIAVNRVLTRVEWALALLENGDEKQAQLRMTQALEAVPAAVAQRLPPLWRRDVEALSAVAELLRDASAPVVPQTIAQHRQALVDDKDIEVLPLLDAATALAFWRAGQADEAAAAVDRLTATSSVSSGARSFPAWVRARVLAGQEPSAAVRAQQDHADLLSRLRWESREAVLAAARTHIAAERRQGEHDRLSRAVNTDPLTGLHNRRVFDSWLDRRAPGRARPTALLLVDLDDFKTVNDTFGHDYGDEVLRRFGRLLLTSIRPGDLAVRHGGDEFALLLEDDRLTVAAAQHRASDLRDAIVGEPWSQLAPGLDVTASIGMAVAVPTLDAALVDAAGLYRAADTALYTAKRDGSGLAVHVLQGDEVDRTTGRHQGD
ncbi:MAG TPA: GGDEF domain-containing protein [Actinomycetes bacterium]